MSADAKTGSGFVSRQTQLSLPFWRKCLSPQEHQPQLSQSNHQQQAMSGLSRFEVRLLPAKAMTFLIAKALLVPHASCIPAHQVQ